jgi:hypothetical protein
MPSSTQYGKLYSQLMLKKLFDAGAIRIVADFGCGSGTYHDLLAAQMPGVMWTGIEVWEPYVEQFGLKDKYDRLIVQDSRVVDCAALAPVDLAIFGDMLEHMTREEAIALVDRAHAVAPLVLISIPVVNYPQGPEFGNPYEAHVEENWDHEQIMRSFAGVTAFFIHDHIGVYILTGNETASSQVNALQAVIPELLHRQLPKDRMAWGAWQIQSYL